MCTPGIWLAGTSLRKSCTAVHCIDTPEPSSDRGRGAQTRTNRSEHRRKPGDQDAVCPRAGAPQSTGRRPGDHNAVCPRAGAPQSTGRKPGDHNTVWPRAGAPQSTGRKPGDHDTVCPRASAPQSTGRKPGDHNTVWPRAGAPQSTGRKPGDHDTVCPRASAPQSTGRKPGDHDTVCPRASAPQSTGRKPGDHNAVCPRAGAPQSTGRKPGDHDTVCPRASAPQNTGRKPGDHNTVWPRASAPQSTGRKPGDHNTVWPRAGAPQGTGRKPGDHDTVWPRASAPQSTGRKPGDHNTVCPRASAPQSTGRKPGDHNTVWPRASAPQSTGRKPGDHDTVCPRASARGSEPEAQGKVVEYQPGLRIDFPRKCVEVDCLCVLREGPLELFVCSIGTREHESILATRVRPLHIFQALGLIGLEPGSPVRFDPKTEQVLPPHGTRLRLDVRFHEKDELKVVPARSLMIDLHTERAPENLRWVFAGSHHYEQGRFGADSDGTIACVVDFANALIAVDALHSSSNDALWLGANPRRVPPVGTPVYAANPVSRRGVPPASGRRRVAHARRFPHRAGRAGEGRAAARSRRRASSTHRELRP